MRFSGVDIPGRVGVELEVVVAAVESLRVAGGAV
jgi:hypothetical protein